MDLAAFLGISQFANAGVMLFVHFGDNAPDFFATEQELVKSFSQTGNGNLTANIYLQLSNATIYGYRFSVRYDSGLLDFDSRTQSSPSILIPDPLGTPKTIAFVRDGAIETENGQSPEPGPVPASPILSAVANGKDLYRFNGLLPGDDLFSAPGFYKLASIKFTLTSATPMPPVQIVSAGAFDVILPKDYPFSKDDVVLRDSFQGLDQDGDYASLRFTAFGGSVSGGTVPEPSTALVFGALGVLTFGRCMRSKRK